MTFDLVKVASNESLLRLELQLIDKIPLVASHFDRLRRLSRPMRVTIGCEGGEEESRAADPRPLRSLA